MSNRIDIHNAPKPNRCPDCASQNSFDDNGASWKCRVCDKQVNKTAPARRPANIHNHLFNSHRQVQQRQQVLPRQPAQPQPLPPQPIQIPPVQEANELQRLQIELTGTQELLNRSRNNLQQTQAELQQTQNSLRQTQNELQQSQRNLNRTQSDLRQSQDNLRRTEGDLTRTRNDLYQTKNKLRYTKKTAIFASCILFVGIAVLSSFFVLNNIYSEAQMLFYEENYTEAEVAFSRIGFYRDSKAMITLIKAKYEPEYFIETGDYESLLDLLEFKNMRDVIVGCSVLFPRFIGQIGEWGLSRSWADSSGNYLNFSSDDRGINWLNYSFPDIEGEYYKIEDGYHYDGDGDSNWEIIWSYKILSINQIEIYHYLDETWYTLDRVQEGMDLYESD